MTWTRGAASLVAVGLIVAFFLSAAQARAGLRERDWVTMVVSRISLVDRRARGVKDSGGIVEIRIRIAADGSLEGAAVEKGSGSSSLDERALKAVRAAGPFRPPPAKLLDLQGFTELSFPLELPARASE